MEKEKIQDKRYKQNAKNLEPPKRLSEEPANNCFSRFDTSAGLEPIKAEGPKWQNYRKARRLLVEGGKATNKRVGEKCSQRKGGSEEKYFQIFIEANIFVLFQARNYKFMFSISPGNIS